MASSQNQTTSVVEAEQRPPAGNESQPPVQSDSNEQEPLQNMLVTMNNNMGQMTRLIQQLLCMQSGQASRKRLRPSSTVVREDDDQNDQYSDSDNDYECVRNDNKPPAKNGRNDQIDEDEISLHASHEPDSLELEKSDLLGEASGHNDKEEIDALLKDFESLYDDDNNVTENVSQKLADIANKRWEVKLETDKLKAILQKHKRPANCNEIKPIKVNPSIWRKMGQDKRHVDLKISNLQQTLQKI